MATAVRYVRHGFRPRALVIRRGGKSTGHWVSVCDEQDETPPPPLPDPTSDSLLPFCGYPLTCADAVSIAHGSGPADVERLDLTGRRLTHVDEVARFRADFINLTRIDAGDNCFTLDAFVSFDALEQLDLGSKGSCAKFISK